MTMSEGLAKKRILIAAGLALVILFNLGMRFHLADIPLERDEGEYAYAGWLILKGSPPFAEAYNMKMPGIYAAYALVIGLFGPSDAGIRMGAAVLNSLTALFLFFFFRRRFSRQTSFFAAAFFTVLSLSTAIQGVMANSEHFVLFFASAGLWILMRALESGRLFPALLSGLLFGMAFMMKQHAVFFIMFAGLQFLYAAYRRVQNPRFTIIGLSLFALGVFIPFCAACLYLERAGVFDRFWFWTFDYAREYVGLTSPWSGLKSLMRRVRDMLMDFPLILLGGAVGLALSRRMGLSRDNLFFLYSFTAFSVLAFCPGLYFRPHYFLLAAPALALWASLAIGWCGDRFLVSKPLPVRIGYLVAIFAAAASIQFIAKWDLYFASSPDEISRKIYGPFEPFPEARKVAEYIRDHSKPDDLAAVLGSEPQVYFYAGRRSASGYMYHYPLIEDHEFAREMERDMIAQVETARPEFIVFVNFPDLWPLPRMDGMMRWMKEYLKGYDRVGVIDSNCEDGGRDPLYVWGDKAAGYVPESNCWLMVFQKKG